MINKGVNKHKCEDESIKTEIGKAERSDSETRESYLMCLGS